MANPDYDYEIITADIQRIVKMLAIVADEIHNGAHGRNASKAEIYIANEVKFKLQGIMQEAESLPKRYTVAGKWHTRQSKSHSI